MTTLQVAQTIKLVDLNRQHAALADELREAFDRVLNRGRLILGTEVEKLEENFARLHGCSHAVGVSSGTDALVLALKGLGVGPGDEVIVPAMTFFATAEAVCLVGAKPVFVDVDPRDLGLDPRLTLAALNSATRAIIAVHLHGRPVRLNGFLAMADSHGVAILEDCAQAHGAEEQGRPVGSRSQAGCFSFFPGKNLGALGDGGMITTQSASLAAKVRALANHGRHSKHTHEFVGYNARLDELQAAMLNVKLPHLLRWNQERRALARRYNEWLANTSLTLPTADERGVVSAVHLYVVRCESGQQRDDLAAALKRQNIETGIHYPQPLHLQPAFRALGYARGSFPVAEQAADTMLSLPLFPGMLPEEQDRVVEAVVQYLN